MSKAEIYGLYCPNTGEIKYIGKANNSISRFKSHLRDCNTRNTPVYQWIRSLRQSGQIPVMKVLCVTSDWIKDERLIIKQYRESGAELLNVAIGGNEPYCSPEVRAKNGANNAKNRNKEIWKLKQALGCNLRFLKQHELYEAYDRVVCKLHLAAIKSPVLFGEYANLKLYGTV